jgi:hypothetical protein
VWLIHAMAALRHAVDEVRVLERESSQEGGFGQRSWLRTRAAPLWRQDRKFYTWPQASSLAFELWRWGAQRLKTPLLSKPVSYQLTTGKANLSSKIPGVYC